MRKIESKTDAKPIEVNSQDSLEEELGTIIIPIFFMLFSLALLLTAYLDWQDGIIVGRHIEISRIDDWKRFDELIVFRVFVGLCMLIFSIHRGIQWFKTHL